MAAIVHAGRPETGLTRQIREDLASGARNGVVLQPCVDIEVWRQHRLPRAAWTSGFILEPGDDGYAFTIGPFWNHVMNCSNTEHLLPRLAMQLSCKAPRWGMWLELVKQDPQLDRPVDEAETAETAWQTWRRLQAEMQTVWSTLLCRAAEQRALGVNNPLPMDIDSLAADAGLTPERLQVALTSLEGWNLDVRRRGPSAATLH